MNHQPPEHERGDRKSLEDAKCELAALFNLHLKPFFNELLRQGLLLPAAQATVDDLVHDAQHRLAHDYAGPRTVHFGRLEVGCKFTYGGADYVKLDRENARSCRSGSEAHFDLNKPVVHDPGLESLDPNSNYVEVA